jgi:thiol-disulfide isomerase/thioredoxin
MKSLLSILLLSAASLLHGQTAAPTGTWTGSATVKGQSVPLTLQVDGSSVGLKGALLNGPERSIASSTTFTGNHLVLTFNYYAKTLDATLDHGVLTGTFGSTAPESVATRLPITLKAASSVAETLPAGVSIDGDWEVAVRSAKGESAWQLRIDTSGGKRAHAVIQRIDGDTGSLYGSYDPTSKKVRFSHFTAAGPALYTVALQPDGTLLLSNALNDKQTDLVARRPAEARKENLPTTTDPTQQTTVKNPAEPLRFSAPDLSGKVISNTDPQFDGKVVIVAVGGSWCPNCHDEAPFLESLYKQFHGRGLEIVNLSFEEADQLKDPTRLHAFINKYGITYTVLVAGQPDQLNEKLTQFNDLNCWPTSVFVGRDGRVKEVHAGFAGPANPAAHEELKKDVTALVEQLLSEPVPTQSASR